MARWGLGTMLLASCQSEVPPSAVAPEVAYEDCADAACRHTLLVADWSDDPAAVTARVRELTDPVEQVAVISVLTETWPGTTLELCGVLQDGNAEQLCLRTNNRPHLRLAVPTDAGDGPAPREVTSNGVPTIIQLVQSAGLKADLPEVEPTPRVKACEGLGEATCLQGAASEAARSGRLADVVSLCAAVDDERWRDECHFLAAEATLMPGNPTSFRPELAQDAARFCLAASSSQGHCISHLSAEIARRAPSADATDAQGWVATAQAIDSIGAYLRLQDPDLAARVEERMWTEAFWFTVSRSDDPIGSSLDHVPEVWHPAWRAALGAWVMRNAEPASLDDAAAAVASRASRRDGVAKATVPRAVRPRPALLWRRFLPGESEIPRTFFAYEAQRARGDDPDEDLAIALVEAAGHEEPISYDVLSDGLAHPSGRVRWTAARVLMHIDPEERVPRPDNDPDPLVMGRFTTP